MQNFFFIRQNGRSAKVSFEDILFVESRKNYCKIVTGSKVFMALTSMKTLEAALPPTDFCRVHRGYIISLNKMSSFDRTKAYLPGHEISIGDQFRDKLLQRILVLDSRPAPASILQTYLADALN